MARKRKPLITSNDANIKPYLEALNNLAGGDKAIAKGLAGGAQLGSVAFGDGKLGRLDENVMSDPNVANLMSLVKGAVDTPFSDPNMDAAVAAARKAVESSGFDSEQNKFMLDKLKSGVDNAANLTDLEKEMLAIRKAGMGGLDPKQLTALREGGSYDEQGNFVAGDAAINRGLNNALNALNVSNLVSGGPRGRAAAVGARPAIQGALDAQGNLQRRLVMDDYNAKVASEGRYIDTANNINDNIYGLNGRINTANNAYSGFVQNTNAGMVNASNNYATVAGNRAGMYEDVRQKRLQDYQTLTGNIRNDLVYRQQFNMEQMAREKAGFLGAVFGGGGFSAAQQGRKDALSIADKQLEAAKSFGGSGRGGWGGGSSNGNSSSSMADSFETASS